jgi:hypothetical protein
MRLWSLHPKYLDAKGIVAVWREGLLAQKVLRGLSRGYRQHPQLQRFRMTRSPRATIAAYLKEIAAEARNRGYHFDETKIMATRSKVTLLPVLRGQMAYERKHLLGKLKRRNLERFRELNKVKRPLSHPLFTIRRGGLELWEKL